MSAPTISRINPTSGPTTGGTNVIITGTNLASPSSVTFGGTAATIISSSPTSVSVTTPANSAGPSRVVVTTAGGTSTQAVNYNYFTIAVPVITSLSPTNGPESGGNTVTINGSNLLYTTGVTFGTTPASSFAVLSSNQIAAVAPAGTGAVSVTVQNTSGTSGSLTYTYNAIPAPVVSSVSPASGSAAGGNTVTISGSGFTYATAVAFGSTPASSFTVISSTSISAVVPPGPPAGGSVSVLVTGPGGTSPAGTVYTYTATPTPTVTTLTPGSGSVSGGNSVVLVGSNLNGTTGVSFGTTPATSITVVSDSEVDAVTPAHLASTVPVNITSSGGTDSSQSFSFQPAPVISSITPTAGPTSGGTTVTITGAGLFNTLDVYFGTTPATAFTVNSDNSITATAPAGTAGAVSVTATTTSATSNGASFTYDTAPTLDSISPSSGPIAGGNNVTLGGTGFTTASNVFFGANPASFTILSDTAISAVAPAGTGTVSVTVANPGGTSGAQPYSYS
ncbi:hypothetical protein ZTR_08225 [Talaromyces verruculosus]|nr:hypothetical protein ZTR_08225 [Talaromyces verruculosus]